MRWRVGGGKPGIAYSLVCGGAVERIDSGETPNEGFGLIRIAAEEHVGDDGRLVQTRWIWWCVRKNGNTCDPDVDGFSVAGIFEDFGGDVAERAGVGGGLLVGGVDVVNDIVTHQFNYISSHISLDYLL